MNFYECSDLPSHVEAAQKKPFTERKSAQFCIHSHLDLVKKPYLVV